LSSSLNIFSPKAGLIAAVISICFFFEMYLTLKLWYPVDVVHPRVPLIPSIPLNLPAILCGVLTLTMFVSFVLMFSRKFFKLAVIIFLVAVLILILDDVNRLQPWLFLHGLMLLVLAFGREKQTGTLRWMMIFMYLWGGINKLNLNFAWSVFPYLSTPFGFNDTFYLDMTEIGQYPMPAINHLAWIIPATEIFIAIGLIFPRFRKIAGYSAILLHLLTLFALGPLGMNTNSVVWIWNIELIVLVIILFLVKESEVKFSDLKRSWMNRISGIITGVMPLFWYFGIWPHFISFHLYSGYNPNIEYWFVKFNEKILESGYYENGLIFTDLETNENYLLVDYQAANEINVPVFSEEIYFRYTGKKLCECYDGAGEEAGITIKARKKFTGEIVRKRYSCKELLGN
jgi:hypothetical protein